jgi:bacillithiol system protein YtxJ
MHDIVDYVDYEKVFDENTTWVLYKHSPTCPISTRAMDVMTQIEVEIDTPIYVLDVLSTGNTKYQIQDILEIKHESPQAIIFRDNQVLAHANHQSISAGRFHQKLT